MFLNIVLLKSGKILFTTSCFSKIEGFIKKIYNLHIKNEEIVDIKDEIFEYMVSCAEDDGLLYIIIQRKINFYESLNITKELLDNYLKFFISILKKKIDFNSLGKLRTSINKVESNLFPISKEIHFIGSDKSGKKTIFNNLFGLELFDPYSPQIIIFPTLWNNFKSTKKFLKVIKVFHERNLFFFQWKAEISLKKYIIFIEDSSLNIYNKDNWMVEAINNSERLEKALILANKQDLHNVTSPQEIETIYEISTIGFSAIERDASDNFNKIILEYFK